MPIPGLNPIEALGALPIVGPILTGGLLSSLTAAFGPTRQKRWASELYRLWTLGWSPTSARTLIERSGGDATRAFELSRASVLAVPPRPDPTQHLKNAVRFQLWLAQTMQGVPPRATPPDETHWERHVLPRFRAAGATEGDLVAIERGLADAALANPQIDVGPLREAPPRRTNFATRLIERSNTRG